MEELVSVIIPAYNRANTITRAINSVLNQTYRNFEIIIVDDGSLDNTKQFVESIKDKRIVYIRHSCNKGGSASRNTGIKIANGQYVAFLDSDDEWLSEKIEKQLELFHKLGNSFGVIYTGFYIISKNKYIFNRNEIIKKFIPEKKIYVLNDMLSKNCIGTLSTVMVRGNYLNMSGGFDESLKSCQDWDLYIKLFKLCKFDSVSECLVKYYETNDPFRISNKRQAIVSGHERIYNKYNDEINNLPVALKASHFCYVGEYYLMSGALKFGLYKIFKAFIISKNFIYILKIYKGIVVFILYKTRRMLIKSISENSVNSGEI